MQRLKSQDILSPKRKQDLSNFLLTELTFYFNMIEFVFYKLTLHMII